LGQTPEALKLRAEQVRELKIPFKEKFEQWAEETKQKQAEALRNMPYWKWPDEFRQNYEDWLAARKITFTPEEVAAAKTRTEARKAARKAAEEAAWLAGATEAEAREAGRRAEERLPSGATRQYPAEAEKKAGEQVPFWLKSQQYARETERKRQFATDVKTMSPEAVRHKWGFSPTRVTGSEYRAYTPPSPESIFSRMLSGAKLEKSWMKSFLGTQFEPIYGEFKARKPGLSGWELADEFAKFLKSYNWQQKAQAAPGYMKGEYVTQYRPPTRWLTF